MDKKNIRSILQEALDNEISSKEVNLWSTVKANLTSKKYSYHNEGEKIKEISSHRLSTSAIATLLIFTFLTAVAVTPQGRAFAQNLIRFFSRTESTSFELEPSKIVVDEPDSITPSAAPVTFISVAEAEVQIGFDVAELPKVPSGFEYMGARIQDDGISIEYEALGGGGNLTLRQSLNGFEQSAWDEVPENVIVPVKIGAVDGEYVHGTFVVQGEDTTAKWNPDVPVLRLRWKQNGIWFELSKFGDVEMIEYLNQEEMIKLAESLAYIP